MAKAVVFVDYFSYENITLERMRPRLEELASNGVRLISLSGDMMKRLADHPEDVPAMHRLLNEFGITCHDAHGLWRDGEELTLPFEGDRKRMISRVARTLELAAEFGCRTLTIHTTTWANSTFKPRPLEQWREYIADGLEHLIPVAKRLGVCIAMENIWGPCDTPLELAAYARQFDSPFFGLCYDAGHAHVMSASGVRTWGCLPWIWDGYGEVQWFDNALDIMLPYVVTAHLHDNLTDADSHELPGKGTIDWHAMVPKLFSAPRLISVQSEVSTALGYSVRQIRDAFKAVLPKSCFSETVQ